MMGMDHTIQRIDLFNGLKDDGAFGRIAQQQVTAVRQAQDEILDDCQKAIERWCARRHRTTEALAGLSNDALQAKSPQELMHAWMKWYQGVMERLAEDVTDQTNAATSVARCCAKGPVTAALKPIPVVAEVALATQQPNGRDHSATDAKLR